MKKKKKRPPFTHLTHSLRDRIEALRENHHSQKEIAQILKVAPSTICRELKRVPIRTRRYDADRSHEHAGEKRNEAKQIGMRIDAYSDLKEKIVEELKAGRSPDEIAGRMKKEKRKLRVGKDAIYQWLYETAEGQKHCRHLCSRKKRRRRQKRENKREMIPNRKAEQSRIPKKHVRHGEGDCFVSPISSGDKAVGVLGVEVCSKLLSGRIVERKQHVYITPAMQRITRKLSLDTLTLDNGNENIPHELFGPDAYFTRPGTPSDKPRIESSIGHLRRWFIPKGTKLSTLPDPRFQKMLNLMNHKYRKSLGYRSSFEVALERGILKKIPRKIIKSAIAFR